jgi:hypothetical protein
MKGACADRQRQLVRLADPTESAAWTAADRADLEAHLDQCADCRAALAEQRFVAGVLQSRPALQPSPAFAVKLAARLDEVSGWFGLLDWRTWTLGLAPVALAIFLIAVFAGSSSNPTVNSSTAETPAATLETWTRGVNETSSVASAVWQDRTSSDALLETMLLGGSSQTREDADVR